MLECLCVVIHLKLVMVLEWVDIGIICRKQKRYAEAIAEYRTALQLDPQYADAHNNCGAAYYYMKRYDDAIAEYQTALRLDPNCPNAAANLKLAQDAKTKAGK